jgi:L-asparagine permease
VVGWFAVRNRVLEIAREREGFTGSFPVVANRPPPRDKDEDNKDE